MFLERSQRFTYFDFILFSFLVFTFHNFEINCDTNFVRTAKLRVSLEFDGKTVEIHSLKKQNEISEK